MELPPRGTITLFRKPIVIDDAGLALGARRIAWDDVDYYTYRYQDGHVAGDLLVVARTGAFLRVDHRYYEWRAGADRIVAELHPRLRRDPYFRPFELTETELVHAASGTLALADIERVELAQLGDEFAIAVIRRGGRGDWSRDDLFTVCDSLLFLDELARRGVAVRGAPGFWLPPCLDELAVALASEVRLPRARSVTPR